MSQSPFLALTPLAALALTIASPARADQGFAEPPDVHVAESYDRPVFEPSFDSVDPHASVVRLLVGPAAKVDTHGAQPGLFVASEFGKGPAGLRLEGAWLGVGKPNGVAQYTGELTLDFGGRSRIHPVLGAGGGVARTGSSVDANGAVDDKHGATLGIGVVRSGVSFRLPFEETDARLALDVTGAFPAIRGADAPKDLTPWAMGTVGVMIGF
jgi:hypothetical protein